MNSFFHFGSYVKKEIRLCYTKMSHVKRGRRKKTTYIILILML
jgi:hypothetical protein